VRIDLLELTFGELVLQDRAKYLATLFLDDLLEVIRTTIDRDFTLTEDAIWKYGRELIGPDFGPLAAKLAREPSLIDQELLDLWTPILEEHRPDLVGLTVPFPGTCYGTLRLAKTVRAVLPKAKVALGGGFASGYLRDLDEPTVFELLDYVVLDDGERPLECLIEHLQGRRPRSGLHWTWVREDGWVVYKVREDLTDIPQADIGTPTYAELPLDRYFLLMRLPNTSARLQMDMRCTSSPWSTAAIGTSAPSATPRWTMCAATTRRRWHWPSSVWNASPPRLAAPASTSWTRRSYPSGSRNHPRR